MGVGQFYVPTYCLLATLSELHLEGERNDKPAGVEEGIPLPRFDLCVTQVFSFLEKFTILDFTIYLLPGRRRSQSKNAVYYYD